MLGNSTLPEGLKFTKKTKVFDAETVPQGLQKAHQIALGTWGLLRVLEGELRFVLEDSGESRVLRAGDAQVVEPGVSHHVELEPDARFFIEFHRPES